MSVRLIIAGELCLFECILPGGITKTSTEPGLRGPVVVELSSLRQWSFTHARGGQMSASNQRFLCISSYEKGHDFLRQLADLGVKPTLLTMDKLRDAPWPREIL